MQDQLRQTCRRLLEEGQVQVVIGYGQSGGGPAYPVFITRPEDADQLVWNDRCFANLTTYLKRKEIRSLGKAAVVVKACDERALVVLEKESQIDRGGLVVIGVACQGAARLREPKCESCESPLPRRVDISIATADAPPAGRQSAAATPAKDRFAALDAFLEKSPAERMAFWQQEFARCVKCYACRQACPLCYCERCIVDKNRPTAIDTSATLKGNFAWHITRAFHLAGRCTGCDECTRVCPAGINLRLLNLSLARAAEANFGYRPGVDPAAEAVLGSFSAQDQESFIR